MRFSIVIPVRDEGPNLVPLVDELVAVLGAGDGPAGAWEAVFVDDGSGDDSAAVLAVLAGRFAFLHLLRHPRGLGKSAALRTAALVAGAAWIVTMDGDRQNDPRDIVRLLDRAAESDRPALVSGIRRKRRASLARRLASRFANALRRWLLADDCPDTACGLKLIHRDVFLALPFFDSLHRFLPALVRLHGHPVANLLVEDRQRTAGRSKYSNWRRGLVGVFDLLGVFWLARRTTLPAPGRIGGDSA